MTSDRPPGSGQPPPDSTPPPPDDAAQQTPTDPVLPPEDEGTQVVERQTYVEQQPYVEPTAPPAETAYSAPADPGYVPPASAPPNQGYVAPAAAAAPAQVNVNEPGYVQDTGPGALYYARRIFSLLFSILAVLLILRIVLLLLVANQENAIVDFVYSVTEPFVAPFRGIFALDTVSPGGASVFDIAALVALIGWTLIYGLIMAILRIADRS
jgi:uncharacterized protein YggT (Ycf19 family)